MHCNFIYEWKKDKHISFESLVIHLRIDFCVSKANIVFYCMLLNIICWIIIQSTLFWYFLIAGSFLNVLNQYDLPILNSDIFLILCNRFHAWWVRKVIHLLGNIFCALFSGWFYYFNTYISDQQRYVFTRLFTDFLLITVNAVKQNGDKMFTFINKAVTFTSCIGNLYIFDHW